LILIIVNQFASRFNNGPTPPVYHD
jgi:hypothetical protein